MRAQIEQWSALSDMCRPQVAHGLISKTVPNRGRVAEHGGGSFELTREVWGWQPQRRLAAQWNCFFS